MLAGPNIPYVHCEAEKRDKKTLIGPNVFSMCAHWLKCTALMR